MKQWRSFCIVGVALLLCLGSMAFLQSEVVFAAVKKAGGGSASGSVFRQVEKVPRPGWLNRATDEQIAFRRKNGFEGFAEAEGRQVENRLSAHIRSHRRQGPLDRLVRRVRAHRIKDPKKVEIGHPQAPIVIPTGRYEGKIVEYGDQHFKHWVKATGWGALAVVSLGGTTVAGVLFPPAAAAPGALLGLSLGKAVESGIKGRNVSQGLPTLKKAYDARRHWDMVRHDANQTYSEPLKGVAEELATFRAKRQQELDDTIRELREMHFNLDKQAQSAGKGSAATSRKKKGKKQGRGKKRAREQLGSQGGAVSTAAQEKLTELYQFQASRALRKQQKLVNRRYFSSSADAQSREALYREIAEAFSSKDIASNLGELQRQANLSWVTWQSKLYSVLHGRHAKGQQVKLARHESINIFFELPPDAPIPRSRIDILGDRLTAKEAAAMVESHSAVVQKQIQEGHVNMFVPNRVRQLRALSGRRGEKLLKEDEWLEELNKSRGTDLPVEQQYSNARDAITDTLEDLNRGLDGDISINFYGPDASLTSLYPYERSRSGVRRGPYAEAKDQVRAVLRDAKKMVEENLRRFKDPLAVPNNQLLRKLRGFEAQYEQKLSEVTPVLQKLWEPKIGKTTTK